MATAQDKKYLEQDIIINASAEQVWAVLIDLEAWKSWNPFIKVENGEPVVGTKLTNTFINGDEKMTFKPKVLKVAENEEFQWIGRLVMPGLFDGKHGFRIEKLSENQVRFVNYEHFKGLFSGMIMNKIYDDTKANFNKMNEALKARAEALYALR